jgi:hypothetical protein
LRSETEKEPIRTELKRFRSVRMEPNRTGTDILKSDPNRIRTKCSKFLSNRMKLEPGFQNISRTETNPNSFFRLHVEPNRTRSQKSRFVLVSGALTLTLTLSDWRFRNISRIFFCLKCIYTLNIKTSIFTIKQNKNQTSRQQKKFKN